jgi:hypothetical protein
MLSTLYDRDFHAWMQLTAELLKQGRFEDLDIGHWVV